MTTPEWGSNPGSDSPPSWGQPGQGQPGQGQPGQGWPPPPGGGYSLPQAPYPPPRATNGMAIASMVLGIIWIYWIGSILALVFGYMAKRQIKERGEAGDGMATAGIILGWIGIGVFVLFMGIFVVVGLSSGFSQ
ncbi:MAG: DUF4190 domain-containing protein [Acidimicrobiales bacterium]